MGRKFTFLSSFILSFVVACSSATNTSEEELPPGDLVEEELLDAVEETESPEVEEEYLETKEKLEDEYDAPVDVEEVEPEGTHLLYEFPSKEILAWPDDYFTREDPDSPTGITLKVTKENAPWIQDVPSFVEEAFSRFGECSGFGSNAVILLRFDGPIEEPPQDPGLDSDALILLDLDDEERIPYHAYLKNGGMDLFIEPLVPFAPAHRIAVVLTKRYKDAQGEEILPSKTMQEVLEGTAGENFKRSMKAVGKALRILQLKREDLVGVLAFTVEGSVLVMKGIAEEIGSTEYSWDKKGCTESSSYRECEFTVRTRDYRDGDVVRTTQFSKEWDVPVSVWLPKEHEGTPFPVILFGHGLGGSRDQGRWISNAASKYHIAVIAVDAMYHGEHPTRKGKDSQEVALDFLGMNLKDMVFNPFQMSGNFQQTALDRLQVVESFKENPDLDGDGNPDLDMQRLAYWGISLGGLLGPATLSLNKDFKAAILTVGGGNLMYFVTRNPQIKPFMPIIISQVGSQEEFDRLLVVTQSLVDPADPVIFAPYVLKENLWEDRSVPDLLFPVAVYDTTVPLDCGIALARALGTPQVKPVVKRVELLDVVKPPVSGNLLDGTVTAGYFQFDRVGGAHPKKAEHNNTPGSPEAVLQAQHFLETWLDTGTAEIIDPYPEIGTPPLQGD